MSCVLQRQVVDYLAVSEAAVTVASHGETILTSGVTKEYSSFLKRPLHQLPEIAQIKQSSELLCLKSINAIENL